MKAQTCSKYSRNCKMGEYQERKMISEIDRRRENGESDSDYQNVNSRMSVSEDGTRTWSF